MNTEEYLKGLKRFNLPKEEFIVLSGGSLLLRGIREKTDDFDLCFSDKLAEKMNVKDMPKNEKGFSSPFEKCEVIGGFEGFDFDIVEGYKCETLENILKFKRKERRPKDLVDIERIEKWMTQR